MKTKTLLIDSSYLLKRSFHGAKEYSKAGHIGGLYSFLTTTRKLIKEHRFNKVVLMWDGENGGIKRYLIDPAYKANRKDKSWHKKIELTDEQIRIENEKSESILKQRKRIQAYVEELYLRQIEVPEVEADDLIAAYCLKNAEKEDIYIFTNDRDYSQLLDLGITILFENIKDPISKSNFIFNFPYHYTNALTMKIICGDDSDNIEGVAGLGEKTLLTHFPDMKLKKHTVRDICLGAKKINEDRVAAKQKPLKAFENLVNSIDRLVKNHTMINLKEPFLNEQAIEELEQLEMPLAEDDGEGNKRGSENLYRMMKEDEFLQSYGGTFVNYVEPFYPVIMKEKDLLKQYLKG
ncbi:MAG: hypothetical protein HC836_32920 [Richelia sp. RM2_1_2]|nr:hypothetical protein [Richelia sp. RM2_1_2]